MKTIAIPFACVAFILLIFLNGRIVTENQSETVLNAFTLNCPSTFSSYATDPDQCHYTATFVASTTGSGTPPPVITYKVSGLPITFPYDFPVGTTTVEVEASDGNSDLQTCYFNVVVADQANPTVTCPSIPLVITLDDQGQGTLAGSNPESSSGNNVATDLPTTPVGWASLNGGTTGGAGGPTVVVSNRTDLEFYLEQPAPYQIFVSGTIDLVLYEQLIIQSNKSVIGLGSDATIRYGGFAVRGNNVIIQNLAIRDSYDGDWEGDTHGTDALTIYGQNIWVDHCHLLAAADGLLDITGNYQESSADYVTVSWTRFSSHNKVMLIGSWDDDFSSRTHLNTTVYNCWFDGTQERIVNDRMPRARFGKVHVFNNYYENVGHYCVSARVESEVLVENCYFRNCSDPHTIGDFGLGLKDPELVARDNLYEVSDDTRMTGGEAFEPATFYAYNLLPAKDVPAIIMNGAGPVDAPNNTPPIARDELIYLVDGGNSPAIIDVLHNDTDTDGGDLRISVLLNEPNGQAYIRDNRLHYEANFQPLEPDTVLYQLIDTQGGTAIGTVVIHFQSSGIPITINSTDNCGLSAEILPTTSFDCSDLGSQAIAMGVVDANGNITTINCAVTIEDVTPPTLFCPVPAMSYSAATGTCEYEATFVATASDNCTTTPLLTYRIEGNPISFPHSFPVGTTTVEVIAADQNDNSTNCFFEVVVIDNEAPSASDPADLILCNGAAPTPDISVVLDATDNCPGVTVAHLSDGPINATGCGEIFTRSYSITDASMNAIIVKQQIIIKTDETDPTVSPLSSIYVNPPSAIPIPDISVVSNFSDDCDVPTVAFLNDVSDGNVNPEIVVRTYRITDACGNFTDVQQLIVIGGCPPEHTLINGNRLSGILMIDQVYRTDGILESIQVLNSPFAGSPMIDYKAGTNIQLLPGFEAKPGVVFRAFIGGCDDE